MCLVNPLFFTQVNNLLFLLLAEMIYHLYMQSYRQNGVAELTSTNLAA